MAHLHHDIFCRPKFRNSRVTFSEVALCLKHLSLSQLIVRPLDKNGFSAQIFRDQELSWYGV